MTESEHSEVRASRLPMSRVPAISINLKPKREAIPTRARASRASPNKMTHVQAPLRAAA